MGQKKKFWLTENSTHVGSKTIEHTEKRTCIMVTIQLMQTQLGWSQLYVISLSFLLKSQHYANPMFFTASGHSLRASKSSYIISYFGLHYYKADSLAWDRGFTTILPGRVACGKATRKQMIAFSKSFPRKRTFLQYYQLLQHDLNWGPLVF